MDSVKKSIKKPLALKDAIKLTKDKAINDKLLKPQKPLTFGIEFEFVVEIGEDDKAKMKTENLKLTPQDYTKVRKYVASMLSPVMKHKTRTTYSKIQENGIPDFSTWYVTVDGTIEKRRSRKQLSYPIELISPALDFSNNSICEVEKACKAITNGCHVDVNKSCGLHVHIGNHDNDLKWEDMRKFVAIVWTFEPHIVQIHPTNRHTKVQCCIIRERYLNKDEKDPNVIDDPKVAMKKIMRYKSLIELKQEHEVDHVCAYNLGKLITPPEGENADPISYPPGLTANKTGKTIEFRQHRATLNTEETISWLHLCAGLYKLAQALDDASLEALLEIWVDVLPDAKLQGLDYIIRNILCLPKVADFYKARGVVNDDDEPTEAIPIENGEAGRPQERRFDEITEAVVTFEQLDLNAQD
ncbi:hypothetical protein GLAREA_10067 [Glarea lozoyensis ATCC 20868]|uniref:Amidoligase enzyme n=1 Tax=Glarea lozoyensis (strain ATCC 20868 / MF5171) TaxID=1116229 RepID=S3E7R8_GLAL2|nr:uncharacterized protein GLAREA_10067 [Glarea lozoyensis ATCC 20868]EPE34373.1 hypothetical protein GLAREA_10067 [Glarea lozoyensis ATCC 20868]